jgi:hypothetical protein
MRPSADSGGLVKSAKSLFWIETSLAACSVALLAVTAVWPDWIEEVSGWDPDQSSGALEWGIVLVLALSTITFAVLARRQWRTIHAS